MIEPGDHVAADIVIPHPLRIVGSSSELSSVLLCSSAGATASLQFCASGEVRIIGDKHPLKKVPILRAHVHVTQHACTHTCTCYTAHAHHNPCMVASDLSKRRGRDSEVVNAQQTRGQNLGRRAGDEVIQGQCTAGFSLCMVFPQVANLAIRSTRAACISGQGGSRLWVRHCSLECDAHGLSHLYSAIITARPDFRACKQPTSSAAAVMGQGGIHVFETVVQVCRVSTWNSSSKRGRQNLSKPPHWIAFKN